MLHDIDETLVNLKKALGFIQSIDKESKSYETERNIAEIMHNIANFLAYQDKFEESIKYSVQSVLWSQSTISVFKLITTSRCPIHSSTYFELILFYCSTLLSTGDILKNL